MIGRTLSHFRIVARIGEGGMGVVYRAEDTKLRRQVALKVLPPELVGNEERRLRFLREARAAAAVAHPNIAHVYEVDEAEGVVFIAMELVEGETLRDVIGGRPMPVKDALRIATDMAEGLARAHQTGVIHRDLKPDNVIVGSDGHAKILDFGLAKMRHEALEGGREEISKMETISGEMTREGKIFGTAAYMSPEQARGQKLDTRSDIFSFGTTLYEMVTGRTPFRGKTNTDILSSVLRDSPRPPSASNGEVPLELDRIISECLEKDPAERYQHSDQLMIDLRKLKRITESGVQVISSPVSGVLSVPLPAWLARLVGGQIRKGVLLIALMALLLGAGITLWWAIGPAKAFGSGDRIFVADFENLTGRSDFDTSIQEAVEDRLALSRFVDVVRGEDFIQLVRDYTNEKASKLNGAMARRIAEQVAFSGFVTGTIQLEGSGYSLGLALHHRDVAEPLYKASAVAASEQEVLITIHQMVIAMRRWLGEAPHALASTMPPMTRSLAAYHAYAIGKELDNESEKLSLYMKALELDPEFIEAYSEAGVASINLGDWIEARKYLKAAYTRSSQLPEQARLRSEILYLDASYDFSTEIDRMKTYYRLYPFDDEGPRGLFWVYTNIYGNIALAVEYARAAYRILPDAKNFGNLANHVSYLGKADEVEALIADYTKRDGDEREIATAVLYALRARGDWNGVLEMLERPETERKLSRAAVKNWTQAALLAIGRLREGHKIVTTRWREIKQEHDTDTRLYLEFALLWLEMRMSGRVGEYTREGVELMKRSFFHLRSLATRSVEMGQIEPLAQVTSGHEQIERESKSQFVQEELQFARGSLALIRGETREARALLEPLTRTSAVQARHHVLARTYEALGQWSEAASEYEEVLREPAQLGHIFIPVLRLDQYRLARVYDRLDDTSRACHWYEQFLTDWKNADPDIPELIEARRRLREMKTGERSG